MDVYTWVYLAVVNDDVSLLNLDPITFAFDHFQKMEVSYTHADHSPDWG